MAGVGTGGRSDWLDLLRALAISLVVLRHGVYVPGFSAPESNLALPGYVISVNGWLGVDLFFVLSGFLLSSQILRALQGRGSFDRRRFLVRRALRTLPTYFFVVLLLWIGFLQQSLGTSGVGDIHVLLVHLVFLNDYLGSGLLITLWSLATEEKFYLLMAFAVPLLWRAGLTPLAIVVCLVFLGVVVARTSAALSNPADSYVEYFWRYRAPFHFAVDGLLLGVVAGAIRTCAGARAVVGRRAIGLGLLLMLMLLSSKEWAADAQPMWALLAVPLFALVSAVLVLAAPTLDLAIRHFRGAGVWRFLSMVSYPLYLVHYPAAQLIAHWLEPRGQGLVGLLVYWSCYLLMSLIVAWVLHVLIERPGLRLRDRLTRGK